MNDNFKILILEDNHYDADMVQRELKKSGFRFTSEIVQTRESYENALESFKPDIILSDYSLPSFDGITAFHIKQKKYPDIPFIIVSGTIGEENAVELLKQGATDYVLKNLRRLSLAVRRALEEVERQRERKRMEKAMEEYIEQYSVIKSAGLFGFLLVDEKGKLLDVNDAYCGMSGYTREELLNLSISDIEAILMPEDITKRIRKVIKTGTDYFESKNKAKDGHVFDVEVSMGFLYSQKQFIAFIRDITDRKLAKQKLIKAKEEAEESDRLKSVFLANISHEIRTPMNGILGFAELLKEPNLTGEEQQEYIGVIEKSCTRMLNIINDIVDISKIQTGHMEVHLKESNINEQLEHIYSLFKPEVEQKGMLLFLKNTLPAKEAIIKTDHEKIFAILVSLIKNAIKFTSKGSIEFGYEKRGRHFEFFVKDTGMGIPTDKKKTIFERFVQTDSSNEMAYQGAGLGLSIAKAYVEMLGGKIWVESEKGKGSTFYFIIPHNKNIKDKPAADDVSVSVNENQHVKNLKTLIAEDDEISKMLISRIAKDFSREIIKVGSGIEAVEVCRNNPDIDLILMDIQMPLMDGLKATRQIRRFNKDVVIIAQTAFTLNKNKNRAMLFGCNDFISKPIAKETLLKLIHKYF